MTKVSGMIETEDAVGKPTLVRRMSNMLKDGSNSGPPMLFRHASMQKIRHCCQNLNLFPYLLYSFGNSKSHPVARKVHHCLGQFLQLITARIFFLCRSFRQTLLRGIRSKEFEVAEPPKSVEFCKLTPRFRMTRLQKRKQDSCLFLTLAVYFAPLLLVFQLIGLASAMVFEKYTPGFIFLFFALLFLGCISLKILFHESAEESRKSVKIKMQ
ncbi:uncharacterized protein LOC126873385 [Bombus huntii]|uniref:uncharacterized protein LOC126873385 n=1 Tax=Bombus huntii TaxID=85661 RepID=UPI0021AA7CB6|nr:uncharacterized protein LOC126873385 [Bombus huntii]XP_050490182.1 uncharacterized protein LOC126873385 [Bombus huntii]XP_050490183.1 uncharacterized protein LOC126873385 [Bombus huntii]XP_050490185.1 uncharacterized protein LOC126873385 [Bombus huntii]XP_050490186.1 uncharacterized protein LOC126873385 [Bombus huntii]